jgi:hypothetical protein
MAAEYSKRNPRASCRMVLFDRKRIIPTPERKGITEIRIKMTTSFLRNFMQASFFEIITIRCPGFVIEEFKAPRLDAIHPKRKKGARYQSSFYGGGA